VSPPDSREATDSSPRGSVSSEQNNSRVTLFVLVSITMLSLTLIGALLFIATISRPIADDYIHIHRVLDIGIIGSTSAWFFELLGGFLGVGVVSIFAWLVGTLPLSVGYLPYMLFILVVLYVAVLLLLRMTTSSIRVRLIWILALTGPALWLLSIGNLFPEHDLINIYGMLTWISAGYRVHLPVLFVIVLIAISLVKARNAGTLLSSAVIGISFAFMSLNVLPDLASYAASALLLAFLCRSQDSSRNLVSFGCGIVIGTLLLYLTPATAARVSRHPLLLELSTAPASFGTNIIDYVREMVNPSNVLVLLGALSLGTAIVRLSPRNDDAFAEHTRELGKWVTVLVALTGLLILSGALGDTLTYGGVFHRWSVLQIEFLTIIAVGLWLAFRFTRKQGLPTFALASLVFIVAASYIPLVNLYHLSTAREAMWTSGSPAPVGFMEDRENTRYAQLWEEIDARR
jgi:hypothetical protein